MHVILVPRLLEHYSIAYTDFQGAIILDTIMNYDDTPMSQKIPSEDSLSLVCIELDVLYIICAK